MLIRNEWDFMILNDFDTIYDFFNKTLNKFVSIRIGISFSLHRNYFQNKKINQDNIRVNNLPKLLIGFIW